MNEGIVAESISAEILPETDRSLYNGPEEYDSIIYNPVNLVHLTWSTAATAGVDLVDIPDVVNDMLGNSSQLENRLRGFYFGEGKLRINVFVQGMTAACGRAILFLIPNANFQYPLVGRQSYDYNSMINSRILPHIFIDPSKTETYSIEVPLIGLNGVMPLNLLQKSWRAVLKVYTPLGSGTDVEPTIQLQLRGAFVDLKLRGKVRPDVIPHSLVSESLKPNQFSSGLKRLSQLTQKLPLFPALATVSTVSGVAGEMLEQLGFSRPPTVHYDSVQLRTGESLCQVDGKSNGTVLGRSQLMDNTVGNQLMNGGEDDLSISYLLDYPYLVGSTSILNSASPGGAPLAINVNPRSAPVQTLPRLLADGHHSWTGGIEFSFEFVCSVFHRATILLAYSPDGNTPTYSDAVSILENITVTVSGNTHTKWYIPWRQAAPNARPLEHNGQIYVFVVNPPVSNGSTTPVYIDILANYRDVTFHFPSVKNPNRNYDAIPLSSDWVEPQEFKLQGNAGVQFYGIVGGDPTRTLKDLVTRSSIFRSDVSGSSVAKVVIKDGSTATVSRPTWFDVLTPMFFGWRSSLRWNVIPRSATDMSNLRIWGQRSTHDIYDTDNTLDNGAPFNSLEVTCTSVVNGAEFITPFRVEGKTFVAGQTISASPGVSFYANDADVRFDVYKAAGDDFYVGMYLGMPNAP